MNIESEVIAYLADGLGVDVLAQPVDPRPATFVTVERTGGATSSYMDEASLDVQWWAPSVAEASELCAEGVGLLLAMADDGGEPLVCKVAAETSPRYVDPESGQARYQTALTVVSKVE